MGTTRARQSDNAPNVRTGQSPPPISFDGRDDLVILNAIDRLLSEKRIRVSDLAKELGLHCGTVTRFCFVGSLARSIQGKRARVKLGHYKLGGQLFTTREAFVRFVSALNPSSDEPAGESTPNQGPRSPAARRRAMEKAAAECVRLGC